MDEWVEGLTDEREDRVKECMGWMDKLTMVSISALLQETKQAVLSYLIFQSNNSTTSLLMSQSNVNDAESQCKHVARWKPVLCAKRPNTSPRWSDSCLDTFLHWFKTSLATFRLITDDFFFFLCIKWNWKSARIWKFWVSLSPEEATVLIPSDPCHWVTGHQGRSNKGKVEV
jgi:hypothetical protein